MGYPMAKNLRAGLGPEKTLLICDVNSDALDRFKAETVNQGQVKVVSSGYEAANAAVRWQSERAKGKDLMMATYLFRT